MYQPVIDDHLKRKGALVVAFLRLLASEPEAEARRYNTQAPHSLLSHKRHQFGSDRADLSLGNNPGLDAAHATHRKYTYLVSRIHHMPPLVLILRVKKGILDRVD